MDRLDQLVVRSQREIEAHTNELGDTDTGRYFITEASHLLAALRLWAQSQYPDRSRGSIHPRGWRRRRASRRVP
jgi:hypothetical protein